MRGGLFLSIEKRIPKRCKKGISNRITSIPSIIELFTILCLVSSSMLIFISTFRIECYYFPIIMSGCVASFIMWLEWNRRMTAYAVLGTVAGLFLFGFIIKNQIAIYSVLSLYNQIVDTIGETSLIINPKFEIDIPSISYSLYSTLFLCLLAAFSGVIVTFEVIERNRFFSYLYIGFLIVVCLKYRLTPAIFIAAFYIFSRMLLFFIDNVKLNIKQMITSVFAMIIVIGIAFLCSMGIYGEFKRFRTPYEAVNDASFYVDKESDSYGTGRISGLGKQIKTNRTALKLYTGFSLPMYLRGFSGAEFNGSRWLPLDNKKIYNSLELFYKLNSSDFLFYSQSGKFFQLTNDRFNSYRVWIEYSGANNKYCYTPYELLSFNEVDSLKTLGENIKLGKEFKNKKYGFYVTDSFYSNMIKLKSNKAATGKLEDFNNYNLCEENYHEYVLDTYLYLNKQDKNSMNELIKKYKIPVSDRSDLSQAIADVKKTVNGELKYNTNINISAFDKNAVKTLLKKKKSGYDVHYATIGTLLFRAIGIPARYVEGYVVTLGDSIKIKAGTPFGITGKRAHAWVEIYANHIGWTPVELYDDPALKMKSDQMSGSGNENLISNVQLENSATDDFKNNVTVEENSGDISIVLIVFIFFIVIFAVLLIFRRKLIERNRKISFLNENNNIAALNYINYFVKVVRACGLYNRLEKNEKRFSSFLNILSEADRNEFLKVLSICECAAYSQDGINDLERESVSNFIIRNVENLYERQKLLKNIYIYIIKCL